MFGWAKTQQHAWFIVLSFIIMGILTNSVRFVPVLGIVVPLMAVLSVASISLQIVRNHHFTFADLFYPLLSKNRVLKFLIGILLLSVVPLSYGIKIVFNVMMSSTSNLFGFYFGAILIILSIISTFVFYFFPFVVIEHDDKRFLELVKQSYSIVVGPNFVLILVFFFFLIVINMLGSMFMIMMFRFGLLVTIPVSLFASAHLYTKIKDHHSA